MVAIGNIGIYAAPPDEPPFRIDAVVIEEDTCMVLSAPDELIVPEQSTPRILREIYESKPETPGDILVRQADPARIYAIVYDFNQNPSLREEWILSVLPKILEACEDHKFNTICMPLLGTAHRSLAAERFLKHLLEVVTRRSSGSPLRLWLMTASRDVESQMTSVRK